MAPAPSLFPIRISLLLFLSIFSALSAPSSSADSPVKSPSTSDSPLDPKQISALRSLNLATKKDPCSTTAVRCDSASPLRHVTSLTLSNCSGNKIRLSTAALNALPTLTSVRLTNCYVARLLFLSHTKSLLKLTISDANLTGNLPRNLLNLNLTLLDLSTNKLKGKIPDSISDLETLESLNLSSNQLDGEIPSSIGDISSLKNLSLSSNLISGSLPASIGDLHGLEYLDLSSNQFNTTIPHFISSMRSLKYLNLEKNNFKGVVPFNASFIKKLEVFKIGENSYLCYNRSVISSKVKLGLAPCDKHGEPMSPPPAKDDSSSEDDYSDEDESGKSEKHSQSHGPNKVVLGVAIGLSAVVFLIIFCVLISKCCR